MELQEHPHLTLPAQMTFPSAWRFSRRSLGYVRRMKKDLFVTLRKTFPTASLRPPTTREATTDESHCVCFCANNAKETYRRLIHRSVTESMRSQRSSISRRLLCLSGTATTSRQDDALRIYLAADSTYSLVSSPRTSYS